MIRSKRRKSKRSFFITVVLLVLLIVFSHRNPQTAKLPSTVLNTVISPINGFFYASAQSVKDVYERFFGQKSSKSVINQLEIENRSLRDQVRNLENVISQQEFLKNEYELMRLSGDEVVAANVTSMDTTSGFTRFTINRGTLQGIQVGDAVLEGVVNEEGAVTSGLVGRVTETGPNYAKVSTILDQSGNVSIMFSKTGSYGIINSRDGVGFYGYMLDSDAGIAVGDEVVSAGIGGAYPRGIYVGKVSEVKSGADGLTKSFTIQSAVDFNNLYRVLVRRTAEGEKNE
ncbi:MAG: rod shape-determining protein MreC [Peptoniphilaceae bacterium]|nr:rod shape-determining protein MreC [Peptoniphilaceae bacterium]MDD7433855.1 rod shape-determining protein MreC [Peptoniphilaceae bacterium]MDY3075164.1 rod shape-determining protein MreC [Peptoniphilaceae bacterium]MDY3987596.1 rod shape-determining protein MreC [Peptoniphilaceae bacterium]